MQPSIRKIAAACRALGVRVSDSKAREYLAEFAAAKPHKMSRGALRNSGTIVAQNGDKSPLPTVAQALRNEETRALRNSGAIVAQNGDGAVAQPFRLRARSEVSLVSKKIATQSQLSLGAMATDDLDPDPGAASPPPPQPEAQHAAPAQDALPELQLEVQQASLPLPKVDRRPPDLVVACDALALIRPRIEPELEGMTITDWLKAQKSVTRSMARSGMSAAAIDAAHLAHSHTLGRPTKMLIYVQRFVLTGGLHADLSDGCPPIHSFIAPEATAEIEARIIAKRVAEAAEQAAIEARVHAG